MTAGGGSYLEVTCNTHSIGSVLLRRGGGGLGLKPGGGALWYRMATHCQTAARTGRGDRQNIGRSTHLKAEKGGCQLKTKNQIREVTCKICFFSLYLVRYMIFIA